MCLITFAYRVHPQYRLLLIANRDEFYRRPSLPAGFWRDHPAILGGRDLEGGGSWLALSKTGRFATVTNFREGIKEPAQKSRGILVKGFIEANDTPEEWVARHKPEFGEFNGFNLLLGAPESLYYTSNRSDLSVELTPGIYSLSNHLLDSPWPKAEYAKAQLRTAIETEKLDAKSLVETLARRRPFADHQLPSTGIPLEMERTLSAPFIQSQDYGTRCTTVIAWQKTKNRRQQVLFYEQNFNATGNAAGTREFKLDVAVI